MSKDAPLAPKPTYGGTSDETPNKAPAKTYGENLDTTFDGTLIKSCNVTI